MPAVLTLYRMTTLHECAQRQEELGAQQGPSSCGLVAPIASGTESGVSSAAHAAVRESKAKVALVKGYWSCNAEAEAEPVNRRRQVGR
jgi:hypothetical protein